MVITLSYDEIKHETEQAYLIDFGDEEVWVPKSIVEDINDNIKGVDLPMWFIENNELEGYEL